MKVQARQAWLGALETLPLVIAAFPFGIVFGALANTTGLGFAATLGMSAIVFAGASQFIAVTLSPAGDRDDGIHRQSPADAVLREPYAPGRIMAAASAGAACFLAHR